MQLMRDRKQFKNERRRNEEIQKEIRKEYRRDIRTYNTQQMQKTIEENSSRTGLKNIIRHQTNHQA